MVRFLDNQDEIRNALRQVISQYHASSTTQTSSTTSSQNIVNGNNSDLLQNWQKEQEDTIKLAEQSGYKRNLKIDNSQVNNTKFNYKGDSYCVEFNDFIVTIKNKTKNRTVTLNLNNLLNGMERKDKVAFMKHIQTLPGEVLEDLALEVDNIQSSNGRDMHTVSTNSEFVAGGVYRGNKDTITTKPRHLVHELGHAMDYHGINNIDGKNNFSRVEKNPKLKKTFDIGLERFKKAGLKQYDYNDKNTWSSSLLDKIGLSNYCTANIREAWAELYQSLTIGKCKSMNTLIKFFPEFIEAGKEELAKIRYEDERSRHNTTLRTITRAVGERFNNIDGTKKDLEL